MLKCKLLVSSDLADHSVWILSVPGPVPVYISGFNIKEPLVRALLQYLTLLLTGYQKVCSSWVTVEFLFQNNYPKSSDQTFDHKLKY